MAQVNLRRVFVLASLISLVLSYSILWLRMITTPLQYTGTDFVAFYAGAKIAKEVGPSQVYDLDLQKRYEEQLIGFSIQPQDVRIYLNPPFVVPLVRLIVVDDFVNSLILWNVLMAAFIIGGTMLLAPIIRSGFSKTEWLLLIAGLLLFFPSFKSLVVGQSSAIFYFGACVWIFGMVTKKDWLAGAGLAVMTVRPHIVLSLVFPFFFKRRKVFWAFVVCAFLLAFFSFVYCGVQGIEGFFRMLALSGSAQNSTTGEGNMFNLIGLLLRMIPVIPAAVARWMGWIVYLLAILGLCVMWAKTPSLEEKHIGFAVILALFTTPHLHMHDLVLLIVPIVIILRYLGRVPGLAKDAVLLPFVLSLALLSCFFARPLEISIPYFVMLFLLLALWFPGKLFPVGKVNGLSSG